MDEAVLYDRLVGLMFLLAVVTFVLLQFVSAPYGRHEREGWGPRLPARLGWVLMESPSGVGFAVIFASSGGFGAGWGPVALFAMWQVHYAYRTFVFPLRMRGGRAVPLIVVGLAFAFNCLNAYVNARWIGHFGDYPSDWLLDPRFLIGLLVFAAGFGLNLHSDAVLRRLRRPGDTGYRIPQEGLHRHVAAPNYSAEIVEWMGYALAAWSLAGLGFAVYSIANLAPRAVQHLRWYRETFSDYPSGRRALVPFVF